VNELGMFDVKAMVHAIHSIKKRELGVLQGVAQSADAAPLVERGAAGQVQQQQQQQEQQQQQPSPVHNPPRGRVGSGDEWSGGRGLRERVQLHPAALEVSGEAQAGYEAGQAEGQQEGAGRGRPSRSRRSSTAWEELP